jgi:hypothetical protein
MGTGKREEGEGKDTGKRKKVKGERGQGKREKGKRGNKTCNNVYVRNGKFEGK